MKPTLLTAATIFLVAAVFACDRGAPASQSSQTGAAPVQLVAPESAERHFGNIRKLTFGGENAEAYFSHDGKRLIFQSTRNGRTCDQQFVMDVDGSNVHRVSTGAGKTTCG